MFSAFDKEYFVKNKVYIINLVFALFIILWGAWVRLSGSGAGCGEHWPLCNGKIAPIGEGIKTFIEFTHRITSGIFGLTITWMCYDAFKRKHGIKYLKFSVLLAFFLTIVEALIGAVLVKKGLVDKNDSIMRAWFIAFHLVNTFFLVASLVSSLYFSQVREFLINIKSKKIIIFEFIIILLFLLAGSSGAVTALGNTLFPETSLISGLKKDFSASSHFLIKLRIYHPVSAVFLCLSLFLYSFKLKSNYTSLLRVMVFIALGFGVINWLLLAPAWGALIHLLIANLVWIIFIYLFLDSKNKYLIDLKHSN